MSAVCHAKVDRVMPLHGLIVLTLVACGWSFDGLALAADNDRQRLAELASSIVQQTNLNRGVAAVLGAEDDFALELVNASELLVHVRDPDHSAVTRLRGKADEAGLGIDRLVAEVGKFDRLPFADNMIDLVTTTRAAGGSLNELSLGEVLRVLRPEGHAILGKSLVSEGSDADVEQLARDAETAGAQQIEIVRDTHGAWVRFIKPPLQGIDEWTHWEHGPDNNPVSSDSVIRAPYMTQFLAHPMYIGMPSITTAAGGRTFLAVGHISHHRREWGVLNNLIARNGYNGAVLWKRQLPEGYLVHRSAFIATKNTFFMIDGDGCLMLDPQTGERQDRIDLPGVKGEWKWMVMLDGTLYVMSGKKEPGTKLVKGDREFGGWSWADLSPGYYGPQVPFGFGDTLAAYDLDQKKVLWTHKEESVIDSRSLAIRDGKLYFLCPERHLRSISTASGKVVWTNSEAQVRDLISQPGQGLRSTPGFRTMCLVVATPKALIIQGQTRMNVVAVSTEDGYVLWTKRKITNNPNAIYVDGKVILGVGKGGSHVVLDPVSGDVEEDLRFTKVACTRLTASGDSFFCRGEGTLRFDRASKKLLIDGGARPACNDGALPANGMLYIGPWQCDCNLTLIGSLAKCSAGDFRFDHTATNAEHLDRQSRAGEVEALDISENDWPTLRGGNDRAGSTLVSLAQGEAKDWKQRWQYHPTTAYTPTIGVAAGGLVFESGDDGKVRAIEGTDGQLHWQFATAGPIKSAPTLWKGRVYVGSGDGHAYCLEATTGRLLWRFRAAPVERHIMVYGKLSSTWPVNSGVIVQDGIAYLAAGIIDSDGTYVYALDAKTGEIVWQNNSSGHLSPELRKGVSVQGNLAILGDQLLLAGGNQVSPAPFDIKTGELRAKPFEQGRPKANNGQFVGVFNNKSAIVGGRVLFSAADNVATKGSFAAFTDKGAVAMNFGGIPPAWDGETTALVNFKHGSITCYDTDRVLEQMQIGVEGPSDRRRGRTSLTDALRDADAVRWETNLGESNKFEAVSLVVCPNAVIAVVRNQQKFRSQPQWYLTALEAKSGRLMFQRELRGDPLPGGLLVDRDGRIVVTMLDGRVLGYGRS